MSRSLKKVTLLGKLGPDPEVRTTNNGSRVASLSVATSRQSGEGSRMSDPMRLADAAHELGLTWEVAWRYVLCHRLEGERRSRNWYVSRASVEKLAKDLKSGGSR